MQDNISMRQQRDELLLDLMQVLLVTCSRPATATALPRPDRRVANCQFELAQGYPKVPNQLEEGRGRERGGVELFIMGILG